MKHSAHVRRMGRSAEWYEAMFEARTGRQDGLTAQNATQLTGVSIWREITFDLR